MNQRFRVLAGLLGFATIEDFSVALGFNRKYLSILIKRGLNPRFVKRLQKKFPRVNLVYLETGEGDPLLPEGAFDVSDIQRAGQVQLIVDILKKLDLPTLRVVLDGIEKFRETPHFRRFEACDNEPDESAGSASKKK